jgi:signal peptidase I
MAGRTRVDGVELRFWLGVVGLFVVLALLSLWLWAVVPALALRGHSVVVTSGSMGPVIRAGDVLILQPHDGRQLAPGAVITFRQAEGRLVTHRIVGVNADGTYQTRGDANAVVDSGAVPGDRIVGRAMILVPMIGLPRVWLTDGRLSGVAVWLATVGLAAWTARYAVLRRFDPWNADLRPPSRSGTAQSWSVGLWELDGHSAQT